MADPNIRRRKFLKRSAPVVGLGLGSSVAGCTGGSSGSDGSGGSGSSDGSGSSGGSGGSGGDDGSSGSSGGGETTTTASSSGELTEMSVGVAPSPYHLVPLNRARDTGVLQEKMNAAGYEISVTETWSGAPVFASGKLDVSSISPTEAAFLAGQREIDVVCTGKTLSNYAAFATRTDSGFAVDSTGSVQASMQKLADEGTVAIGGWESGEIPVYRVLFPRLYDLEFSEDGDFEVVTTDLGAIPQLVAEGEVDAGSMAGLTVGKGYQYVRGDANELSILQWASDALKAAGFNGGQLGGFTIHRSFADEHPEAIQAYQEAWQEGVDWFFSDPVNAMLEYQDAFGIEDEAELEWLAEYAINTEHMDLETPVVFRDLSLSDTWKEQQTAFLELAAERTSLVSDWSEYIEYRTV